MRDENEYLWDPGTPTDPEIARMEALLRPLRYVPAAAPAAVLNARPKRPRRTRPAPWMLALAAGLLLAVGLGVAGWFATAPGSWRVTRTAGAPRVNATPIA